MHINRNQLMKSPFDQADNYNKLPAGFYFIMM